MGEIYPIRILNLFTIMNRGGAETMVMNYYRNIDKSLIQFDFMVHRQDRGAYDDEIEAMGGKIYRMPPIRPWSAKSYKNEIRRFYSEHPEYQIIHSHMSELGYYDFIESEKAGVPVRICHAHNRPYGFNIKTPVRWFYKTMMQPYVTDRFMCGMESGLWLFGEKNKSKLIQMNNAIDAAQYRFNPALRKEVRDALGLKDNQITIGHVGRFNAQKNHQFIIDIFHEIHEIDSSAVLILVGDDKGDDGHAIHEKVDNLGLSDVVKFLGTRSDVPDLLQAMDVFLFPSLFEGLSVASIEAQASGLPVLLSDTIPIECKKTDLVQVLSLKESPKDWAETVLNLAKTPRRDTFEEIKTSGFDIKENAKWLQEYYLSALKR